MTKCPKDWCGPWRDGLCVDCGDPRRLGDSPSVPLAWCDGTPHAPDAIPPLPLHDWRFDADNPWSICARCGASDAASELVASVAEAESKALAEHLAGTCYLSEWSCSHCEVVCVAPPGNLCTETGCWDADRCIARIAPSEADNA